MRLLLLGGTEFVGRAVPAAALARDWQVTVFFGRLPWWPARMVADTVADTWAWLQTLGGAAPQRPDRPLVGLDAEKEARLLAAAG